MDTKILLTKTFLDTIGLPSDQTSIEKTLWIWWANPRNLDRSFALTANGYQIISKEVGLKFYQIDLPEKTKITNQITVWLDKFIDCPYYLDKKSIYVSREKVAVQLILFSGDLYKFGKAKETSKKNSEFA
jgi:hypothetical protein